jgi:hypothetical protein
MSIKHFLLLLALGLAVVFGMWWDKEHPFAAKVIRNGRMELTAN